MLGFLAALAMFVTPEGEHKWRYVTVEKDPKTQIQHLSREMGYQQLCLNGWHIEAKDQIKVGRKIHTFIEGKCK